MNQNYQFLDTRAREAEAEAEKATLANVRERALRSAATWRGMADRALKLEGDRARADIDRLARKLAADQENDADGDAGQRAVTGTLPAQGAGLHSDS